MPMQGFALLGGKALERRLDASMPIGSGISHYGK